MRGPRLTEENLRNQVDVVKEEIRVNVLNRPYGGFPWLRLPPVMFETFANAHDGYGSFGDLDHATVADAEEFFDKYYASGNAVLAVAGDFDVAQATVADRAALRRRAGAAGKPVLPDFAEPDLTAERRETYTDRLAPLPAVAGGWRLPDPIGEFDALPAVRGARRGADRRRRVPAGRAAGAARPHGHQHRRLHRLHGRRIPGPQPDRDAAAGAHAAGRRRGQGAAHHRRGAGPARHRRDGPGRAGPHPGPDGHAPAARHRRRARPGAADGRAGDRSAAGPSCSTSCPGWSARSPRRRSSPRRPPCGPSAAPPSRSSREPTSERATPAGPDSGHQAQAAQAGRAHAQPAA